MPADPSIYAMLQQGPRMPGPLELAGQAFTIKHMMDAGDLNALQRRKLESDISEEQAFKQQFAGGQMPSVAELYGISPTRAAQYQKTLLEGEKTKADLEKTRAETLGIKTKQLRDQLATIQDDSSLGQWAKDAVGVYGMQAVQGMPQSVADPKFAEWRNNRLMTADQIIERLKPKIEPVNAGGTTVFRQLNPTAPGYDVSPIQHTETPGQIEANRLSRARLGVQAASADPFGTLGIRSIAEGAGALPKGQAAPMTPAGAQAAGQAQTGDAYLATLPKSMADQVKALAEGRMQFPGGFALKSPYWQQMIQSVSQYDPTFDAVNYNARAGVRKDFTSGNSAKSLNALNTVMGHLDDFEKAATALNNTDYPMLNKALNTVGGAVSPDLKGRLNAFNLTKQAVVSEMERAYRGTGGSQADIEHWRQTLNDADSPEAIRASITQGVKLLGSKIAALGDTYSKGMGTTKEGLELLSPKARETFNRLVSEGGHAEGKIKTAQPTRAEIDAELRRRGVIK